MQNDAREFYDALNQYKGTADPVPLRTVFQRVLARAEAAEAEVAQQRDLVAETLQANTALARLNAELQERVAELEEQNANQTFVTDRLPPDGELVEVSLFAWWEPRIVPAARGRWRNSRHETLTGVQGWRPYQGAPAPTD